MASPHSALLARQGQGQGQGQGPEVERLVAGEARLFTARAEAWEGRRVQLRERIPLSFLRTGGGDIRLSGC
ncbi:hypothetical protein ACFQDP_21135 [Methylorubrum zatmanii]|uniref:Uncharacterized protein n=1 Tax=Methylorubrum zatmanii TaxID=29429 RepID=A0ABW1WU65_9HYPH